MIAGPPEDRAEADQTLSNGERLEIPAHKAVLAACCPYFYVIFATEHQRQIYVPDITSSRLLSMLVDYMYTSNINITDDNVLVKVYFNILNLKIKKLVEKLNLDFASSCEFVAIKRSSSCLR